MISSKNRQLLPNKKNLQDLCKSISVLEAILSQEWEYRYYSYNCEWAEDEEFFEMRNGQGDQMLILFREDGCVINGFAHELYDYEDDLPSKKQLTTGMPDIFNEFIFGEPVKTIGTTFCLWTTKLNNWQVGQIENYEDGSDEMLYIFDGNPQTYIDWATQYYEETSIPFETVNKIYSGEILTKEMVLSIVNKLDDWKQLEEDLKEINYPYNFD